MLVLGIVLFVLLEGLELVSEVTDFGVVSRCFRCRDFALVLLDVFVDGFHQAKSAPEPARKRRSFKESRELEQLDRQLPDYETRKQELERAMEQNGADLASISLELAELIATIEAAEERWLELSELAP